MTKPSIPQGTRDFSAEIVRKRNYIFSTIRNAFELYGFQPLETPAFENIETLMGKYGEEGDKLIYRILNSGEAFDDHLASILFQGIATSPLVAPNVSTLVQPNSSTLVPINTNVLLDTFKRYQSRLKIEVSGKALKYDLTIPFARYIAMNHTKLTLPFRRYQIQPVWRADRPQKGRYREFTQCDADVVGSLSLVNEVELLNIYQTVFDKLQIPVSIRINNRKILQGIAEYCGCIDKLIDITTAIDKLDKVGKDKIAEELETKGIPQDKIRDILNCIDVKDEDLVYYTAEKLKEHNFSDTEVFDFLKIQESQFHKDIGVLNCLEGWFSEPIENDLSVPLAPSGLKGIEELRTIFQYLVDLDLPIKVSFDTTLARGLNYYTGTIIEVKAPASVKMGSIGGGGRYDDLTGLFGVPNIPGVGISFGVDRIYDVLEEMNLFPENLQVSTKALFFNMGEAESRFAFGIMQQLRSNGIACELYHEAVKINKQFTYAEKKNIPFVIIIGSKEMEEENCSVKNLDTGVQEVVALEKLVEYLKNL